MGSVRATYKRNGELWNCKGLLRHVTDANFINDPEDPKADQILFLPRVPAGIDPRTSSCENQPLSSRQAPPAGFTYGHTPRLTQRLVI